jgi:ATP-dependent 26S proteasome regulatory subunit
MTSTQQTLELIESRILSGDSFLILESVEEQRWQLHLETLAQKMGFEFVTWTATAGPSHVPHVDHKGVDLEHPLTFLRYVPHYNPQTIFLLKDFHPFLDDPLVIRQLRDLAPQLESTQSTLLFLSPSMNAPVDLAKSFSHVALPFPGMNEIQQELELILKEFKKGSKNSLTLTDEEMSRVVTAVAGLTLNEASRAIRRSLLGKKKFDQDVITILVAEKKYLLQGNEMLEFQELREDVDDVGGLEGLKTWIDQRAKAFAPEARAQGIIQPKGVLLLGVQGCGKSLSARVIARQLSFPLVRLDFSTLLQSGRGNSEQNLRHVLSLMESMAPAVLWMEEIDKGFAGFQSEAEGDAAMSRMVGRFLTWLQEHEAPVFVVATANAIEMLPPELLRRGRFDELFFIDLPNPHERTNIFKIHLEKRGIDLATVNLEELCHKTEGYSGAEIEQIVNSAVIEAYTQGKTVTQHDLLEMRDLTVPMSVTLEEPIHRLREWARTRCRPATPDSRVMRMLEDENRLGDNLKNEKPDVRKWELYLQRGSVGDALVEFIRANDSALLPTLQESFAEYQTTEGNTEIVLESDPNVVIWQGLSLPFAEQIVKYVHSKRIYFHQTEVTDYQEIKRLIRLPVLRELRDSQLPRKVWLPCSLRIMPPAAGSGRLGKLKIVESEPS